MKRTIAAALVAACVLAGTWAQGSGAASADPFSIWDYSDNPAASAFFPDSMAMGVRASASVADLAAYSGGSLPASYDLVYGFPGLFFRYADDGLATATELTTGFAVGKAFAFGWRMRWDGTLPSSEAAAWGYQDLGVMLRLANFMSLSFAFDDALDLDGDGSEGVGLGLALRPLAFDRSLESLLTLSVDATWADSFVLGKVGARAVLEPWLSVSGWYSPADSSFGLGLSLALSGMETSAGYDSSASGAVASLAQGVRVGRETRSAERAFGAAVLVIDEHPAFAGTPSPLAVESPAMAELDLWYGQALAAVRKAAGDKGISALVIIEPPAFGSEARAQEFGRALAAFRAASKPVYVFARSMDRLAYVYEAAGAELVALDPNGMLAVQDVASYQFYFKDLFEKLGIDVYNLQSHDTKTAYNMLSESGMTAAERAQARRYVDGLAAQAYAALESARGPKLKAGAREAIAAGPYLDPTAAVAAGLVDALMYRDEFDEAVAEKTGSAPLVDIKAYARERGLSWGEPFGRRVAVVYLSGNIIVGEGVAGQSIGDSATEFLAALRDDATVAGVILRVDSGGGSALTSDHIAREVRKLTEAGKPVIVSMAGYAASGGYYIAAFADEIFAEAGTITGSIGVTGVNFNAMKLLGKLGVGFDGVAASESATVGSLFLPTQERTGELYRSAIEYTYGRFVAVVAEGRGMEAARVDELGKGQVWLGTEAVANGLVDSLGGLDDAMAAMEERLGAKAVFYDCLPGDLEQNPFAMMLGASLSGALGLGPVPESVTALMGLARDAEAMGSGLLYLEPDYLFRAR